MDPRRLLADDMAKQGEGGQPTRLFGHTVVHLVKKVLFWEKAQKFRKAAKFEICGVNIFVMF